jgi:hypothetical protein
LVPLNAALDGVSLEGVFNASNAASRWSDLAGFLFEEEDEAALLDMIARERWRSIELFVWVRGEKANGLRLQRKDEAGKEAERTGPLLILYSWTGTNDATCVQTPGIQQ